MLSKGESLKSIFPFVCRNDSVSSPEGFKVAGIVVFSCNTRILIAYDGLFSDINQVVLCIWQQ